MFSGLLAKVMWATVGVWCNVTDTLDQFDLVIDSYNLLLTYIKYPKFEVVNPIFYMKICIGSYVVFSLNLQPLAR